MRKLVGFQLDNDETAEQAVVEYQISEKFVVFKQDSFLAGYKRKTVAQLQQKRLKIGNQRTLQIFFVVGRFGTQTEKFQYHRVFDDLSRRFGNAFLTGNLQHNFLIVAQQQTFI